MSDASALLASAPGDDIARLILKALKSAGGNGSQAARLLSISPQAVHKFLKEQEEVAAEESETDEETAKEPTPQLKEATSILADLVALHI